MLCIQRIAYYICVSYIFISGLGGRAGGLGELCYEKRWCVRMRARGTDQSGDEAYICADSLVCMLVS